MTSQSVTINERLRPVASSLPSDKEKDLLYDNVYSTLEGELAMMEDVVSRMASVISLLKNGLPYFFWVGFYLINPRDPSELIIGPYQGTYACTHIAMNRGVCGHSATAQKTVIVPNVNDCLYHIACDSKSQSEIVVPVFREGALFAVLDVDSEYLGAFTETDATWLEKIVGATF